MLVFVIVQGGGRKTAALFISGPFAWAGRSVLEARVAERRQDLKNAKLPKGDKISKMPDCRKALRSERKLNVASKQELLDLVEHTQI